MRYQVPQFIEVEDKVFGPLTIKQFIYLAGGAGITLIFVTLFPLYIAFVLSAPILAFSGALAFVKINGRPFINSLEHAFSYFAGTKLYLWKAGRAREKEKGAQAASALRIDPSVAAPKLSESKLKDLAWSLNIKDRKQMGVGAGERGEFQI